jgi:hypothetical protein
MHFGAKWLFSLSKTAGRKCESSEGHYSRKPVVSALRRSGAMNSAEFMRRKPTSKVRGAFEREPGSGIWWIRYDVNGARIGAEHLKRPPPFLHSFFFDTDYQPHTDYSLFICYLVNRLQSIQPGALFRILSKFQLLVLLN